MEHAGSDPFFDLFEALTSQEPLPEAKEDINSAYSLSVEAAYINQNFSQQVLIRDGNKLGYVSRVHPRDHFNHVILAVVGYKPREFAAQINLNTTNMWGIIKSIVDLCMKLNEGKYVLVKDPSKPQVRIYEVPADAFENDYVEEPLPEDEQVQPPAEEANGGEANAAITDVEEKE
ncbi:unnamed protein product, partial [Vitis vinifera]